MSASDFYPPSNRRRCVKGRPSYVEPSDNILFPQVANSQDFNGNSDSCSDLTNEYSCAMDQSEDVEEDEPITIDLSAFLNENPLLAQAAFESSAENNAATTESSSQFRVTDCQVKPTEDCKINESFNPISSLDKNGVDFAAPVPLESQGKDSSNSDGPFINITDLGIEKPSIATDATTNKTSPENNLLNSISPRDAPLNGKISPIKKFPKAKPLGLSNPLKKYKNFFKSKDLNKTNERVFGKYPLVRCEKLDIENFMKNNKIKISNWPLSQAETPKSNNNLGKNIAGKRLGLTKGPLKPKLSGAAKQKLLRKPISFDQYLNVPNNGMGNIFNSLDRTSKPIIIRTDSWKPEITNSAHVPTYFKNLIKPPTVSPKTVLGDLLKLNLLNDQTVSPYSIPETKVPTLKQYGKTAVNYPRIAPKLAVLSTPDVIDVASNNLKPNTETLPEAVVSNEYTVIEPYVEDPTSPQKPKPILTVPIELISSPEKHNIIVHPNASSGESPAKNSKSVFLNGAFKQISTPTRVKKASPVQRKTAVGNRRGIGKKKVSGKQVDAPEVSFTEDGEESSDILKAKNAVVDAMQIAIDLNLKKAKKEPVSLIPAPPSLMASPSSSYGSLLNGFASPLCSSAYSSILNDFMVSGFNDELEDPSNSVEDEAPISLEPPLLPPPKVRASNSKGEKIKLVKSFDNSDTLSASECEDEKGPGKRKRKLLLSPAKKCKTSPKKMDSSSESATSVNSSHLGGNKDNVSDPILSPSLSFSQPEDASVPQSDNTHIIPPETNENSCNNVDIKQETRTRTLRERKCSSTEVDKNVENTSKQHTHTRHSLENDNSVKTTPNSKLKIQKKTPPRSTAKVKIKRKSCKKEDIIQEIKQITAASGAAANGKKRFKKHAKQPNPKDNGENSNISDINSNKDESESNSTSTLIQWKCHTAHSSFSKNKKRTLKVRIKRSKKRTLSKVSLNDSDAKDVLSDNNSSLTSSTFREEEEKMATPEEIKNSHSDCEMEEKKKTPEEHSDIPLEDSLVVKSSDMSDSAADSCLEDSNLLDRCSSPEISFNDSSQEPNGTLSSGDENIITCESSSRFNDKSKEPYESTSAEVELQHDQNTDQESGLVLNQIVDAVVSSEQDSHILIETSNENISEMSPDSVCEQVSSIDDANVPGVVVDNVTTESVDSFKEANFELTVPEDVNNKCSVAVEDFESEKDEADFVHLSDNDSEKQELESDNVSKQQELESQHDDMLNAQSGLDESNGLVDANRTCTETDVHSPPSDLEQNSPGKEFDSSPSTPKKCPKIKIVKKNSVKLCNSSKDWFVSESQEGEEEMAPTLPNVKDLKTSESLSEAKTLPNIECLETSPPESLGVAKSHSKVETPPSGSRMKDASEIAESDLCSWTDICEASENPVGESDKMVGECAVASDSLLNDDAGEMSKDTTAAEQTSSSIVGDFSTERRGGSLNENSASSDVPSDQVQKETSSNVDVEEISAELPDVSTSADVKEEVEDPAVESLPASSKKRGRPPKKKHAISSDAQIKDEVPEGPLLTSTPARGRKKKLADCGLKLEGDECLWSGKRKKKPSLPNGITDVAKEQKATPSSGRKKNYDLELVRMPFNKGWMRERVFRATCSKDNKPTSDIYYFSPEGTKLRSMPEIGSYLAKHPEIDLNLKHFTFAKELIFREPFEIERGARQNPKKVDNRKPAPNVEVLPTQKKKTPFKRKPNKTVDAPSTVEQTVIKRENSPTSWTVNNKNSDSSGDSKNARNYKQQNIEQYLDARTSSEQRSARSSRKIVKKVPFDNSVDDRSKRRQSTELRKVKIKVEPEDEGYDDNNASTSSFVNSNDSLVTTAGNSSKSSNSLIVHFPKVVNAKERSGDRVIDSSPFTVTTNNQLVINRVGGQQRTNVKSPHIQNRLRVKLAHKRYEP